MRENGRDGRIGAGENRSVPLKEVVDYAVARLVGPIRLQASEFLRFSSGGPRTRR